MIHKFFIYLSIPVIIFSLSISVELFHKCPLAYGVMVDTGAPDDYDYCSCTTVCRNILKLHLVLQIIQLPLLLYFPFSSSKKFFKQLLLSTMGLMIVNYLIHPGSMSYGDNHTLGVGFVILSTLVYFVILLISFCISKK